MTNVETRHALSLPHRSISFCINQKKLRTAGKELLNKMTTVTRVNHDKPVRLIKQESKPPKYRVQKNLHETKHIPRANMPVLGIEGISLNKVNITAFDISRSCIEQAKKGLFSTYSFRRLPKSYIQRYFTKTGRNSYTIQPEIRSSVQFRQVNILNETLPVQTHKFHVIFCHNLFIYLDSKSIHTALKQFDLLLDDEGWLFVDSSEGSHIGNPFKRVLFKDNNFVYVKKHSSTDVLKSYNQRVSYRDIPAADHTPEAPKQVKVHLNDIKKIHVQPIVQKKISKHTSHPDDPINNAISAYQAKDFSKAANLFESIIQKHSPYESIAHMGLAKIYADYEYRFGRYY